MKSRYWILYVALATALILAGLIAAKKLLRIDKEFERFLTERVLALTGRVITVEGTEIMPGTVVVRGLRMEGSGALGGLTVERIDVRYDLLPLLVSGFDFGRALTRIAIDHPVVYLTGRPVFPDSGGSGGIPALPDVRLVVSRGELHLAGKNGSVPVCHMLDAFARIEDGRIRGARCDAHFMNGGNVMRRNFSLQADFDPYAGAWKTEVSLNRAALPAPVAWELFIPGIRRTDGMLDIQLSAECGGTGLPVTCTGVLTYAGDTTVFTGMPSPVTGTSFTFVMDGAGGLGKGSARYRAATGTAEGRFDWVGNELRTSFDAAVTGIHGREMYDFVPALRGNVDIQGGSLRAQVAGLLTDLRATGTVTADTVDIRGYRIGTAKGGFGFRDGVFSVNGLGGRSAHSTASAGGTVGLRSGGRMALDLTFTEDSLAVLADAFLPFALDGGGTVTLQLRGRPDSLSYSGRFDLARIAVEDYLRLSTMEGSYTFRGGNLHFASRLKDRSYHLEGMMSSVRDTLALFTRLRMNRVPVDSLSTLLGLERQGVPGHLNALLEISGRGDRFSVKGHGNLIGNPVLEGGFTLDGELSAGDGETSLQAAVALSGMRLNGQGVDASFKLAADRERITVTDADVAGILTGGGGLTLGPYPVLEGRFELSRTGIGELGRYAFRGGMHDAVDGDIEGTVTLGGTALRPEVIADLSITGGRLYRQRKLNGIAAFTVAGNTVTLDNVKLFSGRDELLAVTGTAGTAGLDIVFSGSNVAAEALLRCTPLQTMPLAGRMDYRVSMTGSGSGRLITAELDGRDGRLGTVGFTDMTLRAGWADEVFTIKELGLRLGSDYTVDVFGEFTHDLLGLPLTGGRTADADIRINADGNLLHLIPYHESFMVTAGCNGKLGARLARGGQGLVLDDLNVRFSNGEIEFYGYPVPVQDLNGQLGFDRERRFITAERLYGSLDGNRFSVENRPSVETPDGTMEPFTLGIIDASLGVFLFDFGRGTRNVYIPGLMRRDERVAAVIRGRTGTEKFLLAGPNRRPRLRGEAGINDVDITYPFISDGDGGSGDDGGGSSGSILNRVRWDLKLVAGQKVRYYVEMDLVDRFDAAMEVEEDGELDIQGCLADSTFYLEGLLRSTDGRMHYLGETFDVNEIEVAFDRYHTSPAVSGEGERIAETDFGDSTGLSERIVYLRPYMEDEETGEKIYRARWDRMKLEMSSNFASDDPFSEFAIFDTTSISEKAIDAIGIGVQSYLIRPYMRPLERRLEKWTANFSNWLKMRDLFKLDMVRLDPVIGNLFSDDPAEALLRRSNFTLGKSLYGSMFLTYTGYFDMVPDPTQETGSGLGLQEHRLGLQFKLMRNLRLEYEYDYRIDSIDPHRQGINLKYFWYLDRDRDKK